MPTWRRRTLGVTFALLAGSVALILPAVAGVGASAPLLAAVLLTGVALAAVRTRLDALPTVWELDPEIYAGDLWIGPVLAVATVLLVEPSATAGELQSLGGVLGFLGMVNYFLRPLYLYLYDLVRRVAPGDSPA